MDSLHVLHPLSASTSACGETLFRFNHPKSLDFSGSTSVAMATWSATDSATFPGECVGLANEHAPPVVMFKIIVQLAPQSLLCMQMVVHNIITFITMTVNMRS